MQISCTVKHAFYYGYNIKETLRLPNFSHKIFGALKDFIILLPYKQSAGHPDSVVINQTKKAPTFDGSVLKVWKSRVNRNSNIFA